MKKVIFILSLLYAMLLPTNAKQIEIPRIEKMPNFPQPYEMRSWKTVARDYDAFVFDVSKTGTYMPLVRLGKSGQNYPEVESVYLDTYVGAKAHGNQAEAINIMPAVVGASLAGVDKSAQYGENWVVKLKNFFNKKNGQNVYLNNYSAASGGDWWYDLMPNIYFYQLYSLYPQADADFDGQLVTIADRWLDAVYKLGGKVLPWTNPDMNYRAFNLATGKPLTTGVKEPESAGSIAWLLYQAYGQTGDRKYLEGAQLSLDFLHTFGSNASYELQLPYGTLIAARMNAEQGTDYNVDKLLNWCFDRGSLRGWGAIVGTWGGYDVSGLIGEANDRGNDYAFIMNGFQQAAALAPLVKYDKRYARAIGKWLLNISNASRLMYANALPADLQEVDSYKWSAVNDPSACIPYESMKERWGGKSPFVMGDATGGKWADTNLSLYSGSSVGYLAALIETTDVEGILQIDVNKTDFFGDSVFPAYLLYNPHAESKTVNVKTGNEGIYDVYDVIEEKVIATGVSGSFATPVPADGVRLLVLYPTGGKVVKEGRLLMVDGHVVDYHAGYDYDVTMRVKAMAAARTVVGAGESVQIGIAVDNKPLGASVLYDWYVNGEKLTTVYPPAIIDWIAPEKAGDYTLRVVGTAHGQTVTDSVTVRVVSKLDGQPQITGMHINADMPLPANTSVRLTATLAEVTSGLDLLWSVNGGSLERISDLEQLWHLPSQPGVYNAALSATNLSGSDRKDLEVLVKTTGSGGLLPLVYYPFNGDFENGASTLYPAMHEGTLFMPDARGMSGMAVGFAGSSDLVYTPNSSELNFTDAVFIGAWVSPGEVVTDEEFLISHGSWEERFKLSVSPDMTLRWTVKTSDGVKDIDYKEKLEKGRFYYVGAAYTGYSMELYINGRFYTYAKHSGSMGQTGHDITYARKDRQEQNYHFKGTLDEVRIYNGELTLDEIAKLPETWQLDISSIGGGASDTQLQVITTAGNIIVRTTADDEITGIMLYSIQGLSVNASATRQQANEWNVPVGDLPSGVYLLQVRLHSGETVTQKVLIR